MAENMEGPERDEEMSRRFLQKIRSFRPKEVFTWRLARTLAMGQGLAGLICGTAVSSQYLASTFQVNTPMLQSFLNYLLLCVTYSSLLLCRTGTRTRLHTGLTWAHLDPITLLDCFVIPVLMVLSWWVLKTRYRPIHYISVCICLLGVGAMVGADLLSGRDQGSRLLFASFALCMFALYSFMPIVMKLSSATSVNLSLLTADLFSLFCGIFLFHYSFSGLYLVSLVVILIGFIGFNTVPPHNDPSEHNYPNDPNDSADLSSSSSSSDPDRPQQQVVMMEEEFPSQDHVGRSTKL
ncbi:solute carrier family 35 member F2-like [Stegastes partitus]|uniref:Solute carrier family 35 member F2-like n=1 Tax=Stegastes partitus TaxID=144197 RepID=A0A9Y4NQ13_9TELE|nr:PREDICTED: solute carrier family 35 member F2-like [Stegastes partitus]